MRPIRNTAPVLMVAAMVLGACASAPPAAGGSAAEGSLDGTHWRLVELVSKSDAIGSVRPQDPLKYHLTLAAGGTATARLDCNRGTGSWSVTPSGPAGGKLTFGPMAMTRAMCPPGSLDTRIARELTEVRTYERDGDRLVLYLPADRGDQVWVLWRDDEKPTP
jgi:para-nitrobenzyl esterase